MLISPFLGQQPIIVLGMDLTTCIQWNALMCHKSLLLQSSKDLWHISAFHCTHVVKSIPRTMIGCWPRNGLISM